MQYKHAGHQWRVWRNLERARKGGLQPLGSELTGRELIHLVFSTNDWPAARRFALIRMVAPNLTTKQIGRLLVHMDAVALEEGLL